YPADSRVHHSWGRSRESIRSQRRQVRLSGPLSSGPLSLRERDRVRVILNFKSQITNPKSPSPQPSPEGRGSDGITSSSPAARTSNTRSSAGYPRISAHDSSVPESSPRM